MIEGDEPGQTIVYEISDGGFVDGIEIRQIVEILRVQNEDGANDELSKTDASAAAMMVRNGLLTRLVFQSVEFTRRRARMTCMSLGRLNC